MRKWNEKRLVETFLELVRIDSETRSEQAIQSFLKEQFTALGLTVAEDQTMEETGFGANNLICTLEGATDITPFFFSSHMDTVTPGKGIKPIIKDDIIYSDETTILGADDKAGLAIMLELIRTLQENHVKHGTIEFIITVGEESGLVGAKAFDVTPMVANLGFVLDTGGPVGSITIGSPTQYRIKALIQGISAHAGLEPEKGLSAVQIAAEAIRQMQLGRIDKETTANIGLISGGTATNVVMERLEVVAEARSLSKEACVAQVQHMKETFERVAKEMGGKAIVITEKKYDGYRFDESTEVVQMAAKAISTIGRTPSYEMSGGGSDANIFNGKGKQTTNLAIGYEKIHTVKEYLPIKELLKGLEMAYALVVGMANK